MWDTSPRVSLPTIELPNPAHQLKFLQEYFTVRQMLGLVGVTDDIITELINANNAALRNHISGSISTKLNSIRHTLNSAVNPDLSQLLTSLETILIAYLEHANINASSLAQNYSLQDAEFTLVAGAEFNANYITGTDAGSRAIFIVREDMRHWYVRWNSEKLSAMRHKYAQLKHYYRITQEPIAAGGRVWQFFKLVDAIIAQNNLVGIRRRQYTFGMKFSSFTWIIANRFQGLDRDFSLSCAIDFAGHNNSLIWQDDHYGNISAGLVKVQISNHVQRIILAVAFFIYNLGNKVSNFFSSIPIQVSAHVTVTFVLAILNAMDIQIPVIIIKLGTSVIASIVSWLLSMSLSLTLAYFFLMLMTVIVLAGMVLLPELLIFEFVPLLVVIADPLNQLFKPAAQALSQRISCPFWVAVICVICVVGGICAALCSAYLFFPMHLCLISLISCKLTLDLICLMEDIYSIQAINAAIMALVTTFDRKIASLRTEIAKTHISPAEQINLAQEISALEAQQAAAKTHLIMVDTGHITALILWAIWLILSCAIVVGLGAAVVLIPCLGLLVLSTTIRLLNTQFLIMDTVFKPCPIVINNAYLALFNSNAPDYDTSNGNSVFHLFMATDIVTNTNSSVSDLIADNAAQNQHGVDEQALARASNIDWVNSLEGLLTSHFIPAQ